MTVKSDRNEQSMNPRRVYPDGILADWVNPVYGRTWEPKGSLFPGASDERTTFAQPEWGYDHERARMRNGFAADITGQPYSSTDPEWSKGNQALLTFASRYSGSPIFRHDSNPQVTSDPRSHSGQRARSQQPGLEEAMANGNAEPIRIRKFMNSGVGKAALAGGALFGGYQLLKKVRR